MQRVKEDVNLPGVTEEDREWARDTRRKLGLPVEDKSQKAPDGGGKGVQQQRDRIPHVKDKVPLIVNHDGGRGVQQQRDQVPGDRIPRMSNTTGGRGVQQQNLEHGVQQQRDQIPHLDAKGGEQRDKMPGMGIKVGGKGVSAQRADVPGDQIPFVNHMPGGQGRAAAAGPGAAYGI